MSILEGDEDIFIMQRDLLKSAYNQKAKLLQVIFSFFHDLFHFSKN